MVITTVPPEVLCPQYVVIDQDQDDALEREHSDLTLRILCTQRMYLPRIPFSLVIYFPRATVYITNQRDRVEGCEPKPDPKPDIRQPALERTLCFFSSCFFPPLNHWIVFADDEDPEHKIKIANYS